MKILLNAELIENERTPFPFNDYGDAHTRRAQALLLMNRVVNERYGDKWQVHASDLGSIDRVEYSHGLVGLLSTCYSWHRRITIAPHDLWYVVLTEIANAINEDHETFRYLFTRSKEQQAILVPGDDRLNYLEVVDQLRSRMPLSPELFVFDLSTMGPAEHRAMASALCDGVQRYYSFMTFACGLPEISVTGTVQDWETMIIKLETIRIEFASVTKMLDLYFVRVLNLFGCILNSIQCGSDEQPRKFWESIFSQHNVGSGSQKEISGWIRDLFVKNRVGRLESFTHTRSLVPYKNLETGIEYVAVLGAHSVGRDARGFMHTIYNETIFKKVDDDSE